MPDSCDHLGFSVKHIREHGNEVELSRSAAVSPKKPNVLINASKMLEFQSVTQRNPIHPFSLVRAFSNVMYPGTSFHC